MRTECFGCNFKTADDAASTLRRTLCTIGFQQNLKIFLLLLRYPYIEILCGLRIVLVSARSDLAVFIIIIVSKPYNVTSICKERSDR